MNTTLYNHACTLFPGGVNSPVRAFKGLGVSPLIVRSGERSCFTDVEGKRYLDFCCSWGALILGHADADVVRAAQEQVGLGSSFGITSEWEIKLAEAVLPHFPSIEKIRFVSSGTEATMTALRCARGFTGKKRILKFSGHYHGHSDNLLVQAGSGALGLNASATSLGIHPSAVQETIVLPFNDKASFSQFFETSPLAKEVAAVIAEPIAGNMGVVPPEPGFFEHVQQVCQKAGALLIFDEVITGFRVGIQGAQRILKIKPDLTCLGKIIGGGFPAAAVGGRKEIMDCLAPLGQVYQAGTLSGNPVAMRAGLETLKKVSRFGFYDELEEKTACFCAPLEACIKRKKLDACIQRVGSMFTIFFGAKKVVKQVNLDTEKFGALFRHCLTNGIYLSPSAYEAHFISSAHTAEELQRACEVIVSFLEKQ